LLQVKEAKANGASWYDLNWLYRGVLTFDNSSQSENLTEFPVLVHLTSSNFDFAKAEDNGEDIRFTDSDGSDLLKYEIEEWDKSGEEAFIWVKVPQIDASSSTDNIYMYYGNSSALDSQDAENVWDSHFQMVQHLEESPANDVVGHLDSTSNSNNGTPKSFAGTASSTTDGAGKISGADVFFSDYVVVGDSSSLNITDVITVGAWVKSSQGGRVVQKYVYISSLPSYYYGYELAMAIGSGEASFLIGSGTSSESALGTSDLRDDLWHHVIGEWDGAEIKIFVDGELEGGETWSAAPSSYAVPLEIGHIYIPMVHHYFNGSIEEVRIADTVRSADWIKAQYLSMNDSFITFGTEEVHPINFSSAGDSQNSIGLSVASFPNDSVGSAGYYFYRSDSPSRNSGWIQTNSWTETDLSCGTTYAYSVKYRNSAGVESPAISLSQTTADCDEAISLPPVAFMPPAPPPFSPENPQGEFRISINDGTETTNSRTISLKLFAGSDTTRMAISENPDFSGAGQEPYQTTKDWVLSEGNGRKTVYVKFYTQWGQASAVVSDAVFLETAGDAQLETSVAGKIAREGLKLQIANVKQQLVQAISQLIQIIQSQIEDLQKQLLEITG